MELRRRGVLPAPDLPAVGPRHQALIDQPYYRTLWTQLGKAGLAQLTNRQRDWLSAVVLEGLLTHADLAKRFGVTPGTSRLDLSGVLRRSRSILDRTAVPPGPAIAATTPDPVWDLFARARMVKDALWKYLGPDDRKYLYALCQAAADEPDLIRLLGVPQEQIISHARRLLGQFENDIKHYHRLPRPLERMLMNFQRPVWDIFSKRERNIMILRLQGYENEAVAVELEISHDAVKDAMAYIVRSARRRLAKFMHNALTACPSESGMRVPLDHAA